jgi:glycosyltransferase involved in cell wall biosynthesis
MTSVHPVFDARIFHKQCKSLAQDGYRVILIAPDAGTGTRDGVQLEPIPRWTNRWLRIICAPLAVLRKALALRADIYHFHDPELIPIGLLLRATGKRVIYDIHEDLPLTVSYKTYIPRWLHGILARILDATEGVAGRYFSALIAATPPIADRFRRVNSNVVVIHNFPRMEEMHFRTAATEPDGSALYVGMRITRARGAEEMVRAMGLLPPDMAVRLKLIGAWDPPGLPASLSRIPGWERVTFMGLLGREQLAAELSRSTAGLALLHREPNYVTAQPVKLFEYMCAGLPVIASDLPGCREIVRKARCGLLVDPLNPQEIAEAIAYLWNHPEEAREMGQRGFEAIQREYNWASQQKVLRTLYEALCKTPGARRVQAESSV